MRNGKSVRTIAVSGAALLALAACGGGGEEEGGTSAEGGSEEKQINIYGTDGNVGDPLGEQFQDEGALEGMKGTTPLTELSDDFQERLLAVDPAPGEHLQLRR